MTYVETTSVCLCVRVCLLLIIVTKPCRILLQIGVGVLFTKLFHARLRSATIGSLTAVLCSCFVQFFI